MKTLVSVDAMRTEAETFLGETVDGQLGITVLYISGCLKKIPLLMFMRMSGKGLV